MNKRKQQLEKIKQAKHFDVVIIGAGINGIGTFRDLSLQGVSCLLVDKHDFMSGASSAPSRMIHGGLRYLETGEFGLVKEGVRERNLLLQNAPHLVKPLPTTIPIFSLIGGVKSALRRFFGSTNAPPRRGLLIVKIGLLIYDLFSGRSHGIQRHKVLGKSASLSRHKHLHYSIKGTATYYDACITHPERMGLELIEQALKHSESSAVINYCELKEFSSNTLTFSDGSERFDIQAQLIINASGAWIDIANAELGLNTEFIGGTKGSHLVVDNDVLYQALAGEMLYFEDGLGRVCLAYPFHGKVLVGTTDIKVDSPEGIHCTDEEISYLIRAVRKLFPRIRIDRSQIVFHYAGVRPLARSESSRNGDISRDHLIEASRTGGLSVLSLVGGKWTTYRSFSAECTDLALKELGRKRVLSTEKLTIGGGHEYPGDNETREWLASHSQLIGIDQGRLAVLFDRYGSTAVHIAECFLSKGDTALEHSPGFSRSEIIYLIENEMALHLLDVLLRRTLLAICGDLTGAAVAEIGVIMGDYLGWSEQMIDQEVARSIDVLTKNHGMTL